MKIAIGSDHAAFEMKKLVIQHLKDRGIEVLDLGTNSSERTHYPIYGQRVGKAVANGEADLGITICGTGIGIGMSAGKVKGIRAAIVSDTYSARMARQHNNANVLSFGARVVGPGLAEDIVDSFLDHEFEGGRHAIRVNLIADIDEGKDITEIP
ncbi:MAG: ribose 5-phosphate isomerase B [Anaerolineaceae bacterium]|nr:ribose 5-phosphate isomerase B [Anaerolineaceae bacterium]